MSGAVRSTVFRSGRDEAVRIPAAVRFPKGTKEVTIQQQGKSLIVTPAGASWDDFFAIPKLDDDFVIELEQGWFQGREAF